MKSINENNGQKAHSDGQAFYLPLSSLIKSSGLDEHQNVPLIHYSHLLTSQNIKTVVSFLILSFLVCRVSIPVTSFLESVSDALYQRLSL